MAKLPHSSFALDFLRRLLCADSARGGDIALRRGDDAAAAALREKQEEVASPARSPCIVARLMGLDAMPTPPQSPLLRRSRSASSAEGVSPPPPTPCCSPRPRVARATSASFSDRPTYLRRENDEFLLLSFSPDDAGDDDGLSAEYSPPSRRGADERKQRRERRRRRHGEPGRSRRLAAAAEECGMENSSPVSVLEAQEESSTTTTTSSSSMEEVDQAEQCSPTPDGGEIRLALSQVQGSRRNLPQSPLDDHGGHLPPEAPNTSRASNCSGRERRDRRAVNKAEAIAPAATGMWRIICRLVEDDVCGVKWGGRDESNIADEMESAILDQLICEETDELMQQAVV
ncbi:uncharacterized protein [Lolium perenne]|uniref:uncharacterized protein n=1 Tax=Lolium perenne TaxID=4522 RepID=UPI0021F5B73B|nr:uncharacterized protein LOC127344923 [Lolium perenne]